MCNDSVRFWPHRWKDGTFSIFYSYNGGEECILSNLPIMQELLGIPWYKMPGILYSFNAIDDETHDWCFPDLESTELCIVTFNMLTATKGK